MPAQPSCPEPAATDRPDPTTLERLLVDDEDQHVLRTRSRHAQPRAFLRAVEWSVAQGMHPHASRKTVRVAEDLKERMDYSTGEVRYGLDATAERLVMGRATVARHVRYLREMGCLAWVVHGSKANVRRALGLPGYAATATVYAGLIPPSYDHALGHTVIGSGYSARIVIDKRQEPPVSAPASGDVPVDNSAVESNSSRACETPSLTLGKEGRKVKVESGGRTSTSQARTDKPTPPKRKKQRPKRQLTILGYKITPERIDQARRMAAAARPVVNWTQGATLNELSWVLLDKVAQGRSTPQVILWLQLLGESTGANRRRPRKPHRVIAAALLRTDRATPQHVHHDHQPYERAPDHFSTPNSDFSAARRRVSTAPIPQAGPRVVMVDYPSLDELPVDHWDRDCVGKGLETDPTLVLHYARIAGYAAAKAVYGTAGARVLNRALEDHRAGFAPRPF
ncbi:hypothetical protein [Streptomyces microflavus]|uniref:hypothetical protein n=1 Tax=Streptomyces microflavus TaxID=1919 RepID=UPI0036485AEB